MAKKKRCNCKYWSDYFENKLKGIDVFGEPITLSFNGDYSNITTIAGGICTIVVAVVTGVYLWQQVTILLENKKGVAYSVSDFFTDEETMGNINLGEYDDSFNMIIGTTNKELNFFDNPYISVNVYEMTEKWKPALSPDIELQTC